MKNITPVLSAEEKAEIVSKVDDFQKIVWHKETVTDDEYGNIISDGDGKSFEEKLLNEFCLHSYNCWSGTCQIAEAVEVLHPGTKEKGRPCRFMIRDEKTLGTIKAAPVLDKIKELNQ